MRLAALDPRLPLLFASLLLFAAMAVPRLRRHWPLWLVVLSRIAVFALLTWLVQAALVSPLRPRFDDASAGLHFWQQCVETGWWIAGARVAVGIARLLIVLEHRPRESRIVSDLLAGVIYVTTILAIINFAFAVPIRGLLATSGVIAIVLGLALQSTLSDVFSGIAVGLERPYQPGDLLWVEGGIEGQVIQVNWRSTQIATDQNNIAIVPNSIMAKARLVNRSSPTPVRGDTLLLSLDAGASPERCLTVLTAAVRSCRELLADPAPFIACTGLHGDGASYEIGFRVASGGHLMAARTELFTQIHRHLRHAGIALAVAGIAAPPPVEIPTPAKLLEQSDLFGVIDDAERDVLAGHFSPLHMQAGEILVREGEIPEALFLIASGSAEITRQGPDGAQIVYRMSPGESIGAIGLITGAASMATARTLTEMKLFRLGKSDIAAAMKAAPRMEQALEALAQRSQESIRQRLAAQENTQLVRPEMFLSRLRGFLRLLAT